MTTKYKQQKSMVNVSINEKARHVTVAGPISLTVIAIPGCTVTRF